MPPGSSVEATHAGSAASMSTAENFPVASVLIRRSARPLMTAFYAFARSADDVADDPALSPEAKLTRLALFESGLEADPAGAPEALALHRALAAAGRGGAARHARALLAAFRQDTAVSRYRTWEGLMSYCRMSADPVGRFILDIHDEAPDAHPPANALCTALQVLNHLQDLQSDYRRLDRIYLPLDWIESDGGDPRHLEAQALTPALRATVDRALARTDALLAKASDLPRRLSSRRLAGEVAAILSLARSLHRRLSIEDPLARRIAPRRRDFTRAALIGVAESLRPRRSRQARSAAHGHA
jgi:hydroxysqualene synthase